MTSRTDYEARNGRGVVVHTFASPDRAVAWVYDNADEHDGLHAVAVTTVVTHRRLLIPSRLAARQSQHQGDHHHG